MDLYMVGGAVRDLVLGREPKDRDFVVVGATEQEFRARFPTATPVGKAFQVWLVPGLGEVAFARRERKTGAGHGGFDVQCDPTVTLLEDLGRRDLTINAMALPVKWLDQVYYDCDIKDLIDPYDGRRDCENRVLRATTTAFSEDPLRVYRLARFAATLPVNEPWVYWSIDNKTTDLCIHIPDEEIASVSADRIREEFLRAMRGPTPRAFIEVLELVGKLHVHFPELSRLRFVPAGPVEWHPEGDALTHTLLALDAAVKLGANEVQRVATLFHDLGKGTTPPEVLPHHYEHERRGVALVEALADRIALPSDHLDAAVLASDAHLQCHNFMKMRGVKMYDLVKRCSRNPLGPEGLAMVAECDARARPPAEPKLDGPNALRIAAGVYRIKLTPPPHLKGEAIGQWMRRAKGSAMKGAVDMLTDPVVRKVKEMEAELADLMEKVQLDKTSPAEILEYARGYRTPSWLTSGRHG